MNKPFFWLDFLFYDKIYHSTYQNFFLISVIFSILTIPFLSVIGVECCNLAWNIPSKMLVYCHKMNIIMIMSAISHSTQPAWCHTSYPHINTEEWAKCLKHFFRPNTILMSGLWLKMILKNNKQVLTLNNYLWFLYLKVLCGNHLKKKYKNCPSAGSVCWMLDMVTGRLINVVPMFE